MDYSELNDAQKGKMSSVLRGDASRVERMEWEDTDLLEILSGHFPKLRVPYYFADKLEEPDKNILTDVVSRVQRLISGFSYFETDANSFISELQEANRKFEEHHSRWPGIDVYAYEYWMKLMKQCLILGEGGIGKTYFVHELENVLTENGIKHLCIYGKYLQDVTNIDFDQITTLSNKEEFVLIVDAYNELPVEVRSQFLDYWKRTSKIRGLRVIVTLRTGTLSNDQNREIEDVFKAKYQFRGVSFEAALELLKRLPITELYQYEDILYSNNALQLKMLHTVLTRATRDNEEKNSIARITYIIENYIKSAASRDIWLDTKKITNWIYGNESTQVPIQELKALITNVPRYINSMNEIGLISTYSYDGTEYLVYTNESIMDYLVARNLFKELGSLDRDGQCKLIKQKVDRIFGLREAAILVIFDLYKDDYSGAYFLMEKTHLLEDLNPELLLKAKFFNRSEEFLKVFKLNDSSELLPIFGGYRDKPFNCTNYLNQYYSNKNHQLIELSTLLSGRYNVGRLVDRLQHILYYINFDEHENRDDDELFFFAMWCSAAPNQNIRYLAIKILYDIASNSERYQSLLVDVFPGIYDYFIQESIIRVLVKCNQTSAEIKIRKLFEGLLSADSFLLAKSLQMICEWKGDRYGYIRLKKENLFQYNSKACISKQLGHILLMADIYEKQLLHFRYWGKDHIDIYHYFISADKETVLKWNETATKMFGCIKSHEEGCWSKPGIDEVKKYLPTDFTTDELHRDSFISSFGKVVARVFIDYGLSYNKAEIFDKGELSFLYSSTRKALIIAQDIYYGSLMCNYYTKDFEVFNGNQNIVGFDVFDPCEYDDSTIHVASPLPTFKGKVTELGNRIVARLEEPTVHDLTWVKDMSITERNLHTLSEPVSYKGDKWVLIAGRIYLRGKIDTDSEWADTYDYWICTSDKYQLNQSLENRYLTIELPEYKGSMEQYIKISSDPHRCHSVYNIVENSDVFQGTTLVLPPADIINQLGLHINISDMTWRNQDNEVIIYCNNCKSSYLTDEITGSVFIRQSDFEQYLNGRNSRFFAYVEKRIPETGYADETSYHLLMLDDQIIQRQKNSEMEGFCQKQEYCQECPFNFENDVPNVDLSEILSMYRGESELSD